MTELTEQQAKEKLNDRLWRLSHLYKIKTKDKQLITLRPNVAQSNYLVEETSKDIILKARQLGFSTLKLIEQLDYTITTPNSNCAVIAHQRDKVQILFEIIRLAFENLPDLLKPKVGYDNRNELYFPELNSKIYVALDTRGETIHNLHVSELAFLEQAEERMLGILESVPKNGIISFESTANGLSGYFCDVWSQDKSEFAKHFFPWYIDSEYQIETNKTMEQLIEEYRPIQIQYGLIPNIWERLNLSKEQFNWYILKARSQKTKIMQEYPSIPTEAFIASGRNIFNMADLQKHQIIPPIARKYRDLLVWENPMPGFLYTIGCDPSEGIGEDNATIEVLNAHTGNQAAEMAVSNVPPDDLAGYLIDIGTWYNKAYVVPELNNHGISVVDNMKKRYSNIYRREVFDKLSNSIAQKLGWKTTLTTKPLMVDALEEAIRNEDIKINSEDSIKELKTFVRTDEENKKGMGAEGSNKDDRVMALALAVQGIRHLPKLKAPKSEAQKKLDEFIITKQLESQGINEVLNRKQVWQRNKRKYSIRGIDK